MRIARVSQFLKAATTLVFYFATVLSLPVAAAGDGHYDLGGPCETGIGPGTIPQIRQAKKSGSWDRVVELEKLNVRAGCSIEYRWCELVNALLEAHRPSEAVQALEEMDSRDFEVNPARIADEHSRLKTFMETSQFKTSPVGMKVSHLRRISDERRIRYRETLRALPPEQRPPNNYVAKGVCPFECCRYGDWSVLEETELVAAPASKRIVGKANKGSRAVGLTGEVHLKPEPVVVLTEGDLPKGSIAFVLDYGGEGSGHVYPKGKVVDTFLGVADYCFRTSESCWGEFLFPNTKRPAQVWWVKVRLSNGVIGWTDKADNFGDTDACA